MLPRSGFPGSPYCSPHHYQHYRIRVAYPRLENFLRGQYPYEVGAASRSWGAPPVER